MSEPLELRERIARRFCATHGTAGVVCEIGYNAADAALSVLKEGLTDSDAAVLGLPSAPEDASEVDVDADPRA